MRVLEKRDVALKSFGGERDVKEAEIVLANGHWTMGYEYARGEEAMIGYTEGESPSGPWRETGVLPSGSSGS